MSFYVNTDDIGNQLKELERLIRKAKKAEDKSKDAEANVFALLDTIGIDLDAPSAAENAENIGDAVSCYINYGEYGLTNVMREIREACHDNP